jgi:hypothetical protein
MKYKKGDIVTVRKDLIDGETYGTNCFVNEMMRYKGTQLTIRIVTPNNYNVFENSWAWTDEMFEPVKEELTLPEILIKIFKDGK